MPMLQFRSSHLSTFLLCGTAFSALTGALALGAPAYAQEVVPTVHPTPSAALFAGIATRPADLATLAGVGYSSSSSVSDSLSPTEAVADPAKLTFAGLDPALQPPPRRRYGRPRYNDSSHNSDGSSKYVFEVAAGFELPEGDYHHYFNTSYAFQVGAGRQFNKKFAVLAQFDYDHFGINKYTLDSQAAIYNQTYGPNTGCGPDQGEGNCPLLPVDGSNHVWSFTLNPTFTFFSGEKYGAYAVVGGGFYHKVTDFTTPQTGNYCDYYGNCYPVTQNSVFDHYTANAVGGNIGIGLTYKFSRFADQRFFIEARYVIVDNAQRTGLTYANALTTYYDTNTLPPTPGGLYQGSNFFPANSNKTTYIPIKVGIRF